MNLYHQVQKPGLDAVWLKILGQTPAAFTKPSAKLHGAWSCARLACVGQAGLGRPAADAVAVPGPKKLRQRGGPPLSGPAGAGPWHMHRRPSAANDYYTRVVTRGDVPQCKTRVPPPVRSRVAGPGDGTRVQERGPARQGHKAPWLPPAWRARAPPSRNKSLQNENRWARNNLRRVASAKTCEAGTRTVKSPPPFASPGGCGSARRPPSPRLLPRPDPDQTLPEFRATGAPCICATCVSMRAVLAASVPAGARPPRLRCRAATPVPLRPPPLTAQPAQPHGAGRARARALKNLHAPPEPATHTRRPPHHTALSRRLASTPHPPRTDCCIP